MRRIFLAAAFAMIFIHVGCDADNSTTNTALPSSPTNTSPVMPQSMKIRLKVEDKVMTATLSDSKTTPWDWASLPRQSKPLRETSRSALRRVKKFDSAVFLWPQLITLVSALVARVTPRL